MKPATTFAHSLRHLLPVALLAFAACKGSAPESATPATPAPPAPAQVTNEFTASADVVAIVPEQRIVTLRREDGTTLDVKADERVRNFAQIKVGDTLKVRYQETLAVRLAAPGESMDTVEVGAVAGRAKVGDKPAAGAGAAIRLRVRIESIDREKEIVTFSLGSGELIARRLQTPQGRDFVHGLKIGDIVQLEITSLLALAIETK